MARSKENYSAGEVVEAVDKNQDAKNANDAGGFRDDLIAGETLTGATLPIAVYQSKSTNKLLACDANNNFKLEFIGFVTSDADDTEEIDFQGEGIVRGFSGLSEGTKYYVQDDRTIGTSPGTYELLVGIAISETELLIMKGSWELMGTDSISSNSTTANPSDTSAIPNGCKFIVCQLSGYSDDSGNYSDQYSSNILLMPSIINSGIHGVPDPEDETSATSYEGLKASISASTLTLETLGFRFGGGRTAYLSGTIYYFR